MYCCVLCINVVGLSGIAVEAIPEERASRSLQRISLMSAVREEVSHTHSQNTVPPPTPVLCLCILILFQILPHPEFAELIKLCELSFEVPSWWLPVVHDTDLIKGVER